MTADNVLVWMFFFEWRLWHFSARCVMCTFVTCW